MDISAVAAPDGEKTDEVKKNGGEDDAVEKSLPEKTARLRLGDEYGTGEGTFLDPIQEKSIVMRVAAQEAKYPRSGERQSSRTRSSCSTWRIRSAAAH